MTEAISDLRENGRNFSKNPLTRKEHIHHVENADFRPNPPAVFAT